MNSEEAWEAIKLTAGYEHGWESAVRAYGAARELKGHVDACGHYQPLHQTPGLVGMGKRCGDGWLCDDAGEIEELG